MLIADDDARVRTALRTFLSACPGFKVIGEPSVPVVAMSLSSALRPDVLAAGAAEFLIKDESAERLLKAPTRSPDAYAR